MLSNFVKIYEEYNMKNTLPLSFRPFALVSSVFHWKIFVYFFNFSLGIKYYQSQSSRCLCAASSGKIFVILMFTKCHFLKNILLS